MATIDLLSPEELEVDCFRIAFENVTPSDDGSPFLTVVIEDKYPEIKAKVIPAPQPSQGNITIQETKFIITKLENSNEVLNVGTNLTGNVSFGLAGLVIDNPSAPVEIPPASTSANQIPDFKLRQFYYRLTNDKVILGDPSTSSLSSPPDWQPADPKPGQNIVYNPAFYRIRSLQENGTWKVIYRFDILTQDDFKSFYPGNNLLEVLINDENGEQILLCSVEIYLTIPLKSVSVIKNSPFSERMKDPGSSTPRTGEKFESKSLKKKNA